jgi:hypothetical protein
MANKANGIVVVNKKIGRHGEIRGNQPDSLIWDPLT